MWGAGMTNVTGKNFDQFMYAAAVSRARIEYLWSGQANDTEETDVPAGQPEEAAFDPEMLKKLAERASNGEGPGASSSSAPSRPASKAMSQAFAPNPNRFAGFSTEVIEAARGLEKPSQSFSSSTNGASNNLLPAAFRKKANAVSVGGASPGVPLAFMKRGLQQAKPTDIFSGQASDPLQAPAIEGGPRSLEDRIQQAEQALESAQGKMRTAEDAGKSQEPLAAAEAQKDEPFKSIKDDGEADKKTNAAAAVRNMVSIRLEQAQKAVEATKSFHASAPEPRTVEPKTRKRSKWESDHADHPPMQDDRADREATHRDDTFVEKPSRQADDRRHDDRYSDRPRREAHHSQSSSSLPSLSRRELAALARGEPNPDAPALGELRAPSNADRPTDDRFGKTGAQVVRESRQRAMGNFRERSRDRAKRARSPSSSPERAGKRLFTNTPSYRLTGSTFSSAPQNSKPAEPKPQSQAAPDLQKQGDLPDWLKDLAVPEATAQPKLGKKYLHMPRMMVEVLSHNGGEALRDCGVRSQCQIRVETMIEEPVAIVSVNGNVGLGESIIRETLANKGLDLPPQDGLVLPFAPPNPQKSMTQQQDVQIPDAMVKHFLGHKGSNMKALHAELDRRHGGARTVSIQILPSILPGGFRRIQITGSNRLEAQALVLQHIEDVKREQGAFSDTRNGVQMVQANEAPAHLVGIRI